MCGLYRGIKVIDRSSEEIDGVNLGDIEIRNPSMKRFTERGRMCPDCGVNSTGFLLSNDDDLAESIDCAYVKSFTLGHDVLI